MRVKAIMMRVKAIIRVKAIMMALNLLYVQYNTKTISAAYRSEYNNKRKKQVILLMISNGKKQHYLAVNSLSALLTKKIIKS